MSVTASALRKDIFRLLDQVLETGQPLSVKRKNGEVKIVPGQPKSKLERLKRRSCILGDPEDLVHQDWTGEWNP